MVDFPLHTPKKCRDSACVHRPRHEKIREFYDFDEDEFSEGHMLSKSDFEEIFDGTCSNCPDEDAGKGLCERCQHLRPTHLLCLVEQARFKTLAIDLGCLEEIKARSTCAFCRVVSQAIEIMEILERTKFDPGITILLYCIPDNDGKEFEVRLTSTVEARHDIGFCRSEQYAILEKREEKMLPLNDVSHQQKTLVGRDVEWPKLRKWIEECKTYRHQDQDSESFDNPRRKHQRLEENSLPPNFMLIDLNVNCLVRPATVPEYAALSYVWGPPVEGQLEATLATFGDLMEPESLSDARTPRTILAAMTTARNLGFRYLWVDRLCIIQDSRSHKAAQIDAMGTIYASASLTICTTGSESSDSGIPGVNSFERAFTSTRECVCGTYIAALLPDPALSRLLGTYQRYGWWSRAWTYQEAYLSRLKLFLTEFQACLQGPAGSWYEGWTAGKAPRDGMFPGGWNMIRTNEEDTLQNYSSSVTAYCYRRLTYQSDVYNAFQGVFKTIYPEPGPFLHGLPEKDFDRAMLWEQPTSTRSDLRASENEATFPTWSWARSAAFTSRTYPEYGTLAKWKYWDCVSRSLKLMRASGSPGHKQYCVNSSQGGMENEVEMVFWKNYPFGRMVLMTAWQYGCFEANFPQELSDMANSGFTEPNQQKLEQRWPDYSDFWEEVFGGDEKWPHNTNLTKDSEMTLTRKPGRLLLRSQVAKLKCHQFDKEASWVSTYLENNEGSIIGVVRVPKFSTNPRIHLHDSAWARAVECPEGPNLVALSIGESFRHFLDDLDETSEAHNIAPLAPFSDTDATVCRPVFLPQKQRPANVHEYLGWCHPEFTFLDKEGGWLLPPPVVNVMMIGWNGDVAYRIGIGCVLLAQWVKLSPEFKTIVLE